MTNWFVSRHHATIEWAKKLPLEAVFVAHLDPADVRAGDCVCGTLPINMVADLCARGVRYFHVILDVPADHRGRELSAADLQKFGIRLQEFTAKEILNG